MRILEAVSSRGSSGAVRYAARVIPLLQQRGHEVMLAALPDSWIASQMKGSCEILETNFQRWPLKEFSRMAGFCRYRKVDLIHSHLTRANNFSAFLNECYGIRNVAHAHENKPHPHYWFHDLVLAVSRQTLASHRRYGAAQGHGGRVLYNFVDTDVFKPLQGKQKDLLRTELGLPEGTPLLVQVGDVGPRKGHSVTLAAMPFIWKRFPEAHIVFIGDGRLPSDDPRIHWLGKREDVPKLLPGANVALLPSIVEPFGLAAIEAMACGVPLVASAVDGLNEVLCEDTAVKIPADAASTLADAVCRLLSNPSLARSMATRGREDVVSRFSPEAHLEQLINCFARVIKS